MAEPKTINDALIRIQELTRLGLQEAAESSCQELLQIAPLEPQGWFHLGMLKLQQGLPREAEAALREATALDDGNPVYWDGLGETLFGQGRASEAETCARRALDLDGLRAASWLNLGQALLKQQRSAEASSAFREALARNPHDACTWSNLGAVEHQLGNLAAARVAFERSLGLVPDHATALTNYALLLADQKEFKKSTALLNDVLAREPNNRRARKNLASVLVLQGLLTEAERQIRTLLSEDPQAADAWGLFGTILQAQGKNTEGLAAFRKSVELEPNPKHHSNLLLSIQYAQDVTPEELRDAHQQWDAAYAKPLLPRGPAVLSRDDPARPLRLGLVSANFRQHPVGFFALRALECLDKARCSIICYSDCVGGDDFTSRFVGTANVWRTVRGVSAEGLADQVRKDSVDILVDLMGHTGQRLLAFARKPAPMQVTWLGYVGTTGLAAMDFLLADRFHVREGEEGWYTETVLRMPNSYASYGPPADTPPVELLPAITARHLTFGCFNNPAKYSPRVMDAWAVILGRTPTTQLLLKYDGLDDLEVQRQVRGHFAQRGVAPERILMEGKVPHRELLATYNRVDLALDTQPYSGGLTTCEALWMGVPVITYPGKTFAGRHSVSHLTNAGFEQFIAADLEGYVELAVEWANRLDELAAIRSQTRECVRQSPLCDAPRFARDLLRVLSQAWESQVGAR